jgi:hypothetical protein
MLSGMTLVIGRFATALISLLVVLARLLGW